jgi:ketosteroid isomerase-like protein
VTLDEVLHDEGNVLVVSELLHGRGRSSGAEVKMRVFTVYRFEEGKVRRRASFTERNAALEAAGLTPQAPSGGTEGFSTSRPRRR